MNRVLERHKRAARCISLHRAAIVLLSLFLPEAIAPALAQPVRDTFSMGQRTTVLDRSMRFETVTFYRIAVPGDGPVVVSPASAPPLQVPTLVGDAIKLPGVQKYGVTLVRLAPHAAPDPLDSVLATYNHQNSGSPSYLAIAGQNKNGNPIYTSGSVEKLVVNEAIVRFKRGTDPQQAAQLLASAPFEAVILNAPVDINRDSFLVSFPGRSGHASRALSNRLDSLDPIEFSQPNFINIEPQRLAYAELTSEPQACDICLDALPTVTSGDPFFAAQWHLKNTGDFGQSHADINIEKAWQVTQGESTVVIAILDDWVDMNHEDLVGKITGPWDAFSMQSVGTDVELAESDDHGTAAAGLAAAVTGNGVGVAGVAAKVMIMPIRTHNPQYPDYVVARAIEHAANNAHVLSMSWTLGDGNIDPPEVRLEIDEAIEKKRVLVFSTGNEQNFPVSYPASMAKDRAVIAVSATDELDRLKRKLNPSDQCDWGAQAASYTVSAPGLQLPTLDRMGEAGFCKVGPARNYTLFGGTSAAAPLVAGIAALMLSIEPQLTPLEVKTRLQLTAEHPNPTCNAQIVSCRPNDLAGWGAGWGRVDACRALGGGDNCARPVRPNAPRLIDIQ